MQSYNQYGGGGYAQPTYTQYPQGGYYQQSQPQAYQQTQPQYSGQQLLNTPQYAGAVPFPSPYTTPPQLQPTQTQIPPRRTHTPHPSRRHTSGGASNGQRLRPAIKNPERTQSLAVPITRSRTHSGPDSRARISSMTRTRTNSSSRPDPDHIFLSIHPPNEMDISNIAFQSTVDELREKLFPMWTPGISHQTHVGHSWHVKFAGSPWSISSSDSIVAQRMVCMIFWVLAHQGYVYLTTINTGRTLKSPRLVFIRAPPDSLAHFFTMSLNSTGDKVTFISPPAIVTQTLGLSLRAAFPRRIANDNSPEEGIYIIQLKGGFHGLGIDKDMFLAHILKHINDYAFKLDASVPMARRGLFGLGGRQELWVFKGSESWWQTQTQGRK